MTSFRQSGSEPVLPLDAFLRMATPQKTAKNLFMKKGAVAIRHPSYFHKLNVTGAFTLGFLSIISTDKTLSLPDSWVRK